MAVHFKTWLRTRRDNRDPIGDLARDALQDADWPTGRGTLRGYIDYLNSRGACPDALDALHAAWDQYVAEVGSPTPTATEKGQRLVRLGWQRISARGVQSWHSPDLPGTWTLAAAWRQITGTFAGRAN